MTEAREEQSFVWKLAETLLELLNCLESDVWQIG